MSCLKPRTRHTERSNASEVSLYLVQGVVEEKRSRKHRHSSCPQQDSAKEHLGIESLGIFKPTRGGAGTPKSWKSILALFGDSHYIYLEMYVTAGCHITRRTAVASSQDDRKSGGNKARNSGTTRRPRDLDLMPICSKLSIIDRAKGGKGNGRLLERKATIHSNYQHLWGSCSRFLPEGAAVSRCRRNGS